MRTKSKTLMAGLFTLAMLLSLLPTVSITAAAETTASCGQVMIVDSGSETLTDVSLEKDVYILQGSELTISGSVTITGDVYVFGTLRNTGTLVVSGTINCLHYNSMLSAGSYDYGYFYSTGSTKVSSLNVTDSWLSVTIPSASHTQGEAVIENEVAATCTTDGSYDIVVYCTVCGEEISRDTVTVDAIGHNYTSEVTTAATHSTAGVMTYTCTVCGATKTETIAKVTFLFDDVKDSSVYYYDAVYWAYDNGITTGTSDTLFSPSADCTRAQFVTFLYRLAGSPTPTTTSCKFTDISASGYYYKAVLWAAENGVTEGTTSTTFSPNVKITRAQAVTMIYRYAGSPSVSTTNPFTDTSSSAYYYNAMLWAVKNGITSGTSKTTFSPNTTCSRAMMVTFLYRYANA